VLQLQHFFRQNKVVQLLPLANNFIGNLHISFSADDSKRLWTPTPKKAKQLYLLLSPAVNLPTFYEQLFVRKCFKQLFSNYSLALQFFVERILAQKLLIKCRWYWLKMSDKVIILGDASWCLWWQLILLLNNGLNLSCLFKFLKRHLKMSIETKRCRSKTHRSYYICDIISLLRNQCSFLSLWDTKGHHRFCTQGTLHLHT